MDRKLPVVVGVMGASLFIGYLILPFFTSTIIPIQDFQYNPSSLKIETGTRVLWINYDVESHDVISGKPGIRDGMYLSDLLGPGGTFIFAFGEPGEYEYYCSIHPYMKGKIIVEQP